MTREIIRSLFKKPLTLNEGKFSNACLELGRRIDETCSPDLFVAIPRAGIFIANELKNSDKFASIEFIEMWAQRPSSRYKTKLRVGIFLRHLPDFLKNILRNLEAILRERSFSKRTTAKKVSVAYNDYAIGKISAARTIVVIDDAIDSGETMSGVINSIKSANSGAAVYVAAITTTFSNPIVTPDICLFKNTIVRFPWSEDYAERSS